MFKNPNGNNGYQENLLEDREELLKEEEKIFEEPEVVIPTEESLKDDPFAELDRFLADSLALQKSKTKKMQGRKLTEDDIGALLRAKVEEEIQNWEKVANILHIVHIYCTNCWETTSYISQTYVLSKHKKDKEASKLEAMEPVKFLKTYEYNTTAGNSVRCTKCLVHYPSADLTEFPLLKSLGTVLHTSSTMDIFSHEQLTLPLDLQLPAQSTQPIQGTFPVPSSVQSLHPSAGDSDGIGSSAERLVEGLAKEYNSQDRQEGE